MNENKDLLQELDKYSSEIIVDLQKEIQFQGKIKNENTFLRTKQVVLVAPSSTDGVRQLCWNIRQVVYNMGLAQEGLVSLKDSTYLGIRTNVYDLLRYNDNDCGRVLKAVTIDGRADVDDLFFEKLSFIELENIIERYFNNFFIRAFV